MHGAVTFSRRLIPWGFDCRVELSIDAPAEGLGPLADGIVNHLVPAGAVRGESITDLKGRDPNELIDSNIPASLLPRGEEIFFAAGRTPTPGEDLPRVEPEKLDEPFAISVSSAFEGFIGAHHIVHRTAVERSGVCAEFIEATRVGRAWPIVLDHVRAGLQLFRSRRAWVFGFAPVVERTVLIEADRRSIKVVFLFERLDTRSIDSIVSDDIFQTVEKIVAHSTGHSIGSLVKSFSQSTHGASYRPRPPAR